MESGLNIDTIISRLNQLVGKEFESSLLINMIVAGIADNDFKKRIEIKNHLQKVTDEGIVIPIIDNVCVVLDIKYNSCDDKETATLVSIAPRFI